MNWFKNLKVRSKMLLSFILVIMLAAGAGVFILTSMRSIDSSYENALLLTGQRMQRIFASTDHYSRVQMIIREIYYPQNTRDDLNRLSLELEKELDSFAEELKRLNEVASPAVIEKVQSVLPLVETYRTDAKNMISLLLAAGEISVENPAYRAAQIQAQQKTNNMSISYANDMTVTINQLSDMAIGVLHNLTEENSNKAERILYSAFIIFAIVALLSTTIALYIPSLISKPLAPLANFMKKAGATGDLTLDPADEKIINKYGQVKDEIGQTINGAATFVQHITAFAAELEAVAGGDLTVDISLLSEADTMGKSLKNMLDSLNRMFGEINASTTQVSTGAKQVSDGAQALAQGSTQQAASIQELSSSIEDIAHRTKENAAIAEKTSKLSETIKENAEKGSRQMNEMITAVNEINEASKNISKIIRTIDDIAFQTNILALNAAVEAARAGQHGKGFAVVAEEVRNLASKSAEAAKDTGHMIQNSMEKAELGARIAGETAASLMDIVSGINESGHLIAEIARSSEEQSSGIAQINIGVDQVAQVVQQNSATAEQSAAAAQEMSSQSALLHQLIAQFKLKENGAMYRHSPHIEESMPRNLMLLKKAGVSRSEFGDYGKY